MQDKPFGIIQRSEAGLRIIRHSWRWRNVRQNAAIWIAELKHAVELSIDLITLLVHGAVVPPAEHGEIRERRRASFGPMLDVMALAEADATAREAAAAVSVM